MRDRGSRFIHSSSQRFCDGGGISRCNCGFHCCGLCRRRWRRRRCDGSWRSLCRRCLRFGSAHWRGRLDGNDLGGRSHSNHRTRRCRSSCRSFGNNRSCRRPRGNGGLSRWGSDDRGRGSRLRNDLARLGTRCRCRGRGGYHRRRRSRPLRGRRRRSLWTNRRVGVPRFLFLFLLPGQHGLQHVSGLGHVRQIDLRSDGLGRARRRAGGVAARLGCPLKVRAHFLGFVLFERTGVSLAVSQAKLRQQVENLPALDFHLAREIVDSNLAHPPLFRVCSQCPDAMPEIVNRS